MGSSSQSSSSSTSNEYTDSANQTLTNSLSGTGDLGIATGTVSGSLSGLSYAYDSNNPVTNTYNTSSYQLGANDSTNPSNTSSASPSLVPSTSNIDWSEIITYIIAGVILVYVLRLLGDKNS